MPTSVIKTSDTSEHPTPGGSHSLTRDRQRFATSEGPAIGAVGTGDGRRRYGHRTVAGDITASVEQTSELALNAVRGWVDSLSWFTPNLRPFPFAHAWRDAMVASFEFAGELLDLHRQFVERVDAALAPLRGRRR